MPITILAGLFSLCPPLPNADAPPPIAPPDTYLVQHERAWGIMKKDAGESPLQPAGDDPAVVGRWSQPMNWDIIAIHTTVLPTGKVLHYAYPNAGSGSEARVWDPLSGSFTVVDMESDIFCSGVSHLPDGTIYVAGGNDDACEFRGERGTNFFHPDSNTWTSGQAMVDGRWYPAALSMPDGSVMLFSGLNTQCETNPAVEQFIPGTGLVHHEWADRYIALYPRMHVLSDGRIAHVGQEQQTYTFDFANGWQYITSTNLGWRAEGTSVLLPGSTDRIMIIGGQSPLTNTTEIIDFREANPSWSYAASMQHARGHADALILPDSTVMVCGGGRDGLYGDPELTPELYDPVEDSWSNLAPIAHGRMYHATTVLLPDARVLVAGQDSGISAFTAEIYEPPYLHRGARPQIAAAPDVMRYGRTYTVNTPNAASIGSVVLVRPSAVTHSVNTQQRLVDLEFTVSSGAVSPTVPFNVNLAPPGFYMLFILNDSGVPSIARMVRIEAARIGDVDGDGDVDFTDLLALLASWGTCSQCAADINGNGVVEFGDLLALLANFD